MREILCAFNEFRINGFHNIPKRLIVAVKNLFQQIKTLFVLEIHH
jgi:hypothetical protein